MLLTPARPLEIRWSTPCPRPRALRIREDRRLLRREGCACRRWHWPATRL